MRSDMPDAARGGAFAWRNRGRHLIENPICQLKAFRRVASRYAKFATNFLSDVALAIAVGVLTPERIRALRRTVATEGQCVKFAISRPSPMLSAPLRSAAAKAV